MILSIEKSRLINVVIISAVFLVMTISGCRQQETVHDLSGILILGSNVEQATLWQP